MIRIASVKHSRACVITAVRRVLCSLIKFGKEEKREWMKIAIQDREKKKREIDVIPRVAEGSRII
jgi:hypothetical protein